MAPSTSKRAALAAALLLAPSPALAQIATSVHAVGEASVGWTDNALSQPATTQTAQVGQTTQTANGGVVAVTFTSLRPGALLLIEGRKTLQRLQYTFTRTIFFGRPEANSNGHQLDYNLLYSLTGRSELLGGVSLTYGEQNIFSLMRPPAGAVTTGLPPGNLTFLTTTAYENYNYEFSNDWRFTQGAAVGTYSVLDVTPPQPHRFTVDNRFALERRYGKDALIGEIYTGLLANSSLEYQGLRTPFQSQLLQGALGRWRRDLTERFSTEVNAGAVVAFNPDDQSSLLGPVLGAAVRFHDELGEAAVGYNRSFTPNVFLGQIFYGDEFFARGTVPVFEQTTHLRFSAGAGATWSNLVNAREGRLSSTLRVYTADVALTWDPQIGVNASLRYQYYNQKGNPDDPQPLFDFSRNAVLFTVGGMFPYRNAPPVPRAPSDRVDRSDRPAESPGALGEQRTRAMPTVPNGSAPGARPGAPALPGRGAGPSL
jgi:hypothetical protein